MDTLVGVIAWPSVFLIIALVIIFVFKGQIATLIARTKKIGKGGLEAYENQPPPPSEDRVGGPKLLTTFDSPMLSEAERLVSEDLKNRRIVSMEDKEQILIRALASANITMHFERIYGILWASQFACLQYLNSRDSGADVSELLPFYEAGKALYPTWYQNYLFDKWLGFLKDANFIAEFNSRILISISGREFLKYLISTGKPGPFYG
ncbi:MAG: hypothetical protein ACRESI_03675 [Gammaproteobacteria bacterium]